MNLEKNFYRYYLIQSIVLIEDFPMSVAVQSRLTSQSRKFYDFPKLKMDNFHLISWSCPTLPKLPTFNIQLLNKGDLIFCICGGGGGEKKQKRLLVFVDKNTF